MTAKRLVFVSLLVVAVVFSGAIVVGFQQYKRTLYAQETAEVNRTTEHVQSELNKQLLTLERTVGVAAANPALARHGTVAQREALGSFVNRSAFAGASVIAANGTMTAIVANVSAESRRSLVGSQFDDREYFRQARDGRTYISRPFKAASGNYVVTVSAPIRREGEVVGTVNAAVHLSGDTFFSRFGSTLEREQGLTIYARDGTAIYDADPDPTTDLITRNATVPATGWTVSVQESRNTVQSTIRTVTYVQIGSLVVLLGMLGGIGWIVYRRNIRQLERLLDGFETLEDGEYGTQITLGSGDEWKRIEAAFNDLSRTLEAAIRRREQQKRAIEEERQRYTTLVEQSQDGIAIVQDAELVFVNEAMTELLGVPEAELVGRSIEEIIVPDDRELVRERHESRIRGSHPPDRYDVGVLTATGQRRDIDLKVARIRHEGEPAVLATFTDVTERKRRAQRLRQFKEAVEQAAHAIYITDPEGTIRYVNPAFEEITGYTADEAVGETPTLLQSSEHDDAVYEELWETITAGNPWHNEMHDETKGGEEIILDQTISPIEAEDGSIEAFVAVNRDITRRKERRRALERYERLVENLPIGVYQNTPGLDGRFELLNDAMVELFDADSKEELREHSVSDLYRDSDDRAAFAEKLAKEGIVTDEEIELETLAGEPIWGSVTAIARDVDGELRFDGVVQDLTERKEYERRLEQQRDDLDILNRVLRHDIRNDLQLVTAYGDRLADHVDEAGVGYLETLRNSADHAIELTETAGEMADVMVSRETADQQRVDLHSTLESELNRIEAEHPDVRLTVEGSLPAVQVQANPMLDSVFRNLLSNAVQHNDSDPPEISVSATNRDGSVVVYVADNGPGVPDGQKDEIFGQGEKGLDSTGTGLGLYLVQHLVTQYGGEVWVEDNEPEGAVFAVELRTVDRE